MVEAPTAEEAEEVCGRIAGAVQPGPPNPKPAAHAAAV